MRRRSSVVVLGLALAAVSLAPARAQERPPVSGAVGIRVTPSNVDPDTLSADFDLTMYTRYGTYPSALAGNDREVRLRYHDLILRHHESKK